MERHQTMTEHLRSCTCSHRKREGTLCAAWRSCNFAFSTVPTFSQGVRLLHAGSPLRLPALLRTYMTRESTCLQCRLPCQHVVQSSHEQMRDDRLCAMWPQRTGPSCSCGALASLGTRNPVCSRTAHTCRMYRVGHLRADRLVLADAADLVSR